jgi:hypothetical protein
LKSPPIKWVIVDLRADIYNYVKNWIVWTLVENFHISILPLANEHTK